MRGNVTCRLARTRAEARDYRSTKSLEGFQIHCLAHVFCNSLKLGGEWLNQLGTSMRILTVKFPFGSHFSSVFVTSSRLARVSPRVRNLFKTSCESKSLSRDA